MRVIVKKIFTSANFARFSLGFLIFAVIYHYSSIQADGYYYLDGGKRILELSGIPDRDVFSFNTGFTLWIVIEWLPNIIFYLMYRISQNLLILSLPAVFSFIVYFAWLKSEELKPSALFIYALIVAGLYAPFFVIRAELLMCLYYFIFFYFVILKKAPLKKGLAIAFFVQILWANSHPSFVLSIIFAIILFAAEFIGYVRSGSKDSYESAKHCSLLAGLLVIASMINPYLWRSFPDFFYRISSFAYGDVDITMPLGLESSYHVAVWIFLFLAAVMFLYPYRRIRDLPLGYRLVIFSQIAMTAYGQRYLIILLISLLPPVSSLIGDFFGVVVRMFPTGEKLFRKISLAIAAAAIIFGVFVFSADRHYSNLYTDIDGAIAHLDKSEDGGNLYNPYEYGTYLIHRLYPKYKVFVDGRSYLYDPNLAYLDSKKIAYSSDATRERLLNCYPVDYVIWPLSDKMGPTDYLKKSKAWRQIYGDNYFVIFKRHASAIGR